MKAQRLRIRYAVSSEATALGQRDIVDAWEQACKAAQIPLAYSEGKRPSPQISIAAPLPQGVTSTCELADLYLSKVCRPQDIVQRLAEHLPCGIRPRSAEEVGVNAPSLQSQVRRAEYRVDVSGLERSPIEAAVSRLLTARTLPARYKREAKVREYDLRPLVLDLRLTDDPAPSLCLRLRAEPERTARADQVLAALDLPEGLSIQRTALILEDLPAVLLNYRRAAEPDE